MALTPSVVVPVVNIKGTKVYRLRTMLDSGSEQNWIAEDVLPFIKHTKITTLHLNIKHFDGTTSKKVDLIQIYVAADSNRTFRIGESEKGSEKESEKGSEKESEKECVSE